MTLYDWFDPKNLDHLKALRHAEASIGFPEGFVPEGISVGPMDLVTIYAKIAQEYMREKLGIQEDTSKESESSYSSKVQRWIEIGKKRGAKYILIVCDTFSYEDYPVYCRDDAELQESKIEYSKAEMQRIESIVTI